MTIFQCQDSPDGILTGVYEAWASHLGHRNIRLEVGENANYEFFSEYRNVSADGEKAGKVARTIRYRLGEEVWFHLYHAALAEGAGKADAIYRTVLLGISLDKEKEGAAVRLMENWKEPCVFQVYSLSRTVSREAHRYLGFVRFREMEGGFLFSEISPAGQILPLIGDHFADRYPMEDFMIYDSRHETYLIHRKERPWVIFSGEKLNTDVLRESAGEKEYAGLWRCFVTAIGIQERKNEKLQQQLLPKKFRKFMTEYFPK